MEGRLRAAALVAVFGWGCGPNIVTAKESADGGSSTGAGPTSAPPNGGSNPSEPPEPTSQTAPAPSTTIKYDIDDPSGFDVPDDGCDQWHDLELLDRAVYFLLDVSQTTSDVFDTSGATVWQALRTGLEGAVGPQTDPGTLAFATFPHPDNEAAPSLDACGGTLGTSPPIADAQTYLRELPDPAATFLGSSSLGGSYILAAQTLLAYSDARPVSTVVFAHRAPNCTPDATPPELFTEVDASVAERAEVFAAVGLQTHVVALGLVEGQVLGGGPQGDALADHLAELDAIAAAGGTQAAIRAGDIAELDAAFAQIEQRTRSCRLELPPIAHGHSWYGVRIAGEDIDETFDCDEVPGFRWVDDGGDLDTIELCPVYCDLLERDPNPQIMPICVIVE